VKGMEGCLVFETGNSELNLDKRVLKQPHYTTRLVPTATSPTAVFGV
jgi:hypothetical protein